MAPRSEYSKRKGKERKERKKFQFERKNLKAISSNQISKCRHNGRRPDRSYVFSSVSICPMNRTCSVRKECGPASCGMADKSISSGAGSPCCRVSASGPCAIHSRSVFSLSLSLSLSYTHSRRDEITLEAALLRSSKQRARGKTLVVATPCLVISIILEEIRKFAETHGSRLGGRSRS